jgi:CTP-dependent riboflavin kinase
MEKKQVYQGTVKPGVGGAATEWSKSGVREDFQRLTGLFVIPGTLNLRLTEPIDTTGMKYVGVDFDPSEYGNTYKGETGIYYCPVTVAGEYPACVCIFTWINSKYHVELVSPYHLRTVLNLSDGDVIAFTIGQ